MSFFSLIVNSAAGAMVIASSIGAAPTATVVPPLRVAARPAWTRLARPTASKA